MTCPSREALAGLLDDGPDAGAPDPARAHVDGCPACRAELVRLVAAVALLRAGSPAPEPSPSFGRRLEARLAALPPREVSARGGPALGAGGRGWRGLAALVPAVPWRLVAAGGVALALAAGVMVVQRGRAVEQLALAQRLELLEDYEVVASVGDVESAEDAAVVAGLDALPAREGRP